MNMVPTSDPVGRIWLNLQRGSRRVAMSYQAQVNRRLIEHVPSHHRATLQSSLTVRCESLLSALRFRLSLHSKSILTGWILSAMEKVEEHTNAESERSVEAGTQFHEADLDRVQRKLSRSHVQMWASCPKISRLSCESNWWRTILQDCGGFFRFRCFRTRLTL